MISQLNPTTTATTTASSLPTSTAGEALPLAILNLRGSQAEMGEQHGRLLRKLGHFEDSIRFHETLARRMLFPRSSGLAERVSAGTLNALLRLLETRRPREYLERSRQFVTTLGFGPEYARYWMLMDVAQNVIGLVGRHRLGQFGRELRAHVVPACSSLAVWGDASSDGTLRHARNFDFPSVGVWDRAPTVVFCTPDQGLRYGFVSTRGADTPGVTCFNEAGLVLSAHTRFHRDVSFTGMGVVDLGHEIIRRAETLEDAVRIARERKIASTWGLAISSGRERRAIVIETTAKRVEVVSPHRDFLTCANRYRHDAMKPGEVSVSPAWEYSSDSREQRLADLVRDGRARGGMSPADIENAMSDPMIGQPITVKTVVVEPEARKVRVAVGPCPTPHGPFMDVDWDWSAEVSSQQCDASDSTRSTRSTSRRDLGPGYEHFMNAAAMETKGGTYSSLLTEMQKAVAAEPDEPKYRFLAGTLSLGARNAALAVTHLERGLLREHDAFRRGQLLLWGARAADTAGQTERANALRDQLQRTDHPLLTKHRKVACEEQEHTRRHRPKHYKPVVSFWLVDAV
jgi:hypothetical protein